MDQVDSPKGYQQDTPTTNRYLWHGLDYGPIHDPYHSHNNGPNSYGLSSHDPNLKPQRSRYLITPALFCEIARLATVVESGSQSVYAMILA